MPPPTISTEVFINHLRDTLRNPDNKICFILGAGASSESGIDSGATLARQWYHELRNYHSAERIEQWKSDVGFNENDIPAFYSKLFRLRYQGHQDDGIHFISSIIEKGSPSFGYTILSQVLQRTPHNVVITTNFDTLTEESLYVFTNKRALICNHENVAHLAKPSSTRPLIVKIHRGLYMDPMNDQDDIAEIKKEWKKALTDIFRNYIPIVIGYGGNDGSLMKYLMNIDCCQRMYWCLNSDKQPRQDIVDVVAHHNGSFVLTGGFNRLMFRFIDLFSLTKVHEGMEQVAKERAEKLRKEYEEAGKEIGLTGTVEEKQELSKVADDFDATDWLQWTLKAEATSNAEEKKKIYLDALDALPNCYQLHYNLGCELSERGDVDGAIAAYQVSLGIEYNNPEGWNNLGASYDDKMDFVKAIDAYKNSLRIKPDYHDAYFNLGITYGKSGNYTESIQMFIEAIGLKADKDDTWFNLGLSHVCNNELDKATDAFKKATEINPSFHQAWYQMGLSYKKKPDLENARKCFVEAYGLYPDDPDYKMELDNLERK